MSTTIRKQKSGDQLTVGDWLAPNELLDGAAEVLYALAYPASADGSRDNDGKHVQLVVREQGKAVTYAAVVSGSTLFDLASDEDLAALREQAERARKIADARALLDWLEANPDMPILHGGASYAYVDGKPKSDHGPEGMAEMRRIAEKLGAELKRAETHTTVGRRFGEIEYEVRCFHRPADPTGLAYSRADEDDPAPVSGARVEPHVGAVTDAGLVDETDEDDPVCRVCQSRYSKHNALGLSLHGLAPANEYDESLDALAPCQPIGCDNGHHIAGCFYAKADS